MKKIKLIGIILIGAWIGGYFFIKNFSIEESNFNKFYPQYVEGGYTDKRTYGPGEEVFFYIGSFINQSNAILNFLDKDKNLKLIDTLNGKTQVPSSCAEDGTCNWSKSFQWKIPEHANAGLYSLTYKTKAEPGAKQLYFYVRESIPKSSILYIKNWFTANAYNIYGGSNVYGYIDRNGLWVEKQQFKSLSFRRPMVMAQLYTDDIGKPVKKIKPSYLKNYQMHRLYEIQKTTSVSVITNDSLHEVTLEYLSKYPIIFIGGLHEYWPKEHIEKIMNYVSRGGNLIMSAKEWGRHPVTVENNHLVYHHKNVIEDFLSWEIRDRNSVLGLKMENLIGVSGKPGFGTDNFIKMEVTKPKHPIFKDVNIKNLNLDVYDYNSGGQLSSEGCILTTSIPCEDQNILAAAVTKGLRDSKGVYKQVIKNYPMLKEQTSSVMGIIKKGNGQIFISSAEALSARSDDDKRLLKNIIEFLLSGKK